MYTKLIISVTVRVVFHILITDESTFNSSFLSEIKQVWVKTNGTDHESLNPPS